MVCPVGSLCTSCGLNISWDIPWDYLSQWDKWDFLNPTAIVGNTGHYCFCSPSGSSVLAWSSISAHAPSQISRPQHQSLITEEPQQLVQPLQSVVPLMDSSDYLYGFDDLSSLLDEPSLSDVGAKSDLGTLLSETLSEPSAAQSANTMPRLESSQSVDYPLSEPLLGGSAPIMHPPMTSSPLLPRQSLSQHGQSTPSVALLAGNPAMVELPPPRKKTRIDLRSEDSGHSTALKDPAVVVKRYANLANVADMGKLACMLARQSFFGDDVLKVSTLHGKSAQFQAMNRQKMLALFATIHELPEFREKTKQEFSLLYMPKMNSSLSRLCTNLREN